MYLKFLKSSKFTLHLFEIFQCKYQETNSYVLILIIFCSLLNCLRRNSVYNKSNESVILSFSVNNFISSYS